jgi:hypothetical protein
VENPKHADGFRRGEVTETIGEKNATIFHVTPPPSRCKGSAMLRAMPFIVLTGCAVAVSPDDTVDTSSDSGKRPPASDGGTMLGQPDSGIESDSGDTDSGTQADTGSQQSSCKSPYSGVIATYDFTNEPGNQSSTPAKSTAPNVTAAAMSRANILSPVAGLNSINSNNWAMTAKVDTTRYYAFSITPPAGCTLDLSTISIDSKSSSTGPASGSVATSDDNFTMQASFTPNSVANAALSVSGSTKSVEVRVYGFTASSTSGTWRVQNTLTISGALK